MKIEGSWYKELKQSEAVGSFWTRGTKVNVGLALFVVSILTLGYVGGSGYLGYSDSDGSTAWSSTDKTMIECSNGKRYNATVANIQIAVWSLNGTTGEVKIPAGNFSIDFLNITDKVTVVGSGNLGNEDVPNTGAGGTQFSLNSNSDRIVLSGGRLWNCKVYCVDGYTGTAVYVYPKGGNDEYSHVSNVLNNVNIICHNQDDVTPTGTGLKLRAEYNGTYLTDYHIGMSCSFENLVIKGFEYGLYGETIGSGWINGNQFSTIGFYGCANSIYIKGCGGNTFDNLQIQWTSGSIIGIYLNETSDSNRFENIFIWDWSSGTSIRCDGADGNYFSGYLGKEYINNTGGNNKFVISGKKSNECIVYPSNKMDGTKINANLNDMTLYTSARIVFMPGTYDIDVEVVSANKGYEFYFVEGSKFIANDSFVDSYMMGLTSGNRVYGSGLFNGKNVAVRGILPAYNTQISGLNFSNFVNYGIYINSPRVVVDNCIFNNISTAGIWLSDYNDTISNCKFSDCALGIKVDSTRYANVFGNRFNGSTIQNAIYVYDTCSNSSFHNNFFTGFNDVFSNVAGYNNSFYDNYFYGVTDDCYTVSSTGTHNILIYDNKFVSFSGTAIVDTRANAIKFNNLGDKYNTFFPFYNQSAAPTMLDDTWAYWYDNDENFFYVVCRVNNTVFYYNTTKTI